MTKVIKIRPDILTEPIEFNPGDPQVIEDSKMIKTLFLLKYKDQGLPTFLLSKKYEEIRKIHQSDLKIETEKIEPLLPIPQEILDMAEEQPEIQAISQTSIDAIASDMNLKVGKKIEALHMLGVRNRDISKLLNIRPQQVSNTLKVTKNGKPD